MVGRRMLFFLLGFNFAYFQVRTVSFREGKSWCKKARVLLDWVLPIRNPPTPSHIYKIKSYMLKMKSNYAEKAANAQGRYKKNSLWWWDSLLQKCQVRVVPTCQLLPFSWKKWIPPNRTTYISKKYPTRNSTEPTMILMEDESCFFQKTKFRLKKWSFIKFFPTLLTWRRQLLLTWAPAPFSCFLTLANDNRQTPFFGRTNMSITTKEKDTY